MSPLRINPGAPRPKRGRKLQPVPYQTREKIVRMYNRGCSYREIQKATGMGYQRVRRVVEQHTQAEEDEDE